jgi:hypothetical protein
MESLDNTHLTAIKRLKISRPAKFLMDLGLINKPALDFGCGYGMDAAELDIDKYDEYYTNSTTSFDYETILCTYVLNTVKSKEEIKNVLLKICRHLRGSGVAYITVRSDLKKLNGYTKRGTWQGFVALNLPVLERNKQFIIYVMNKNSLNDNM